jgi:hypothetical protein
MKLVHLSFTFLLASLLTGIKGQCLTELSELDACDITLTDNVRQACLACLVNIQVPDIWSSCDDLESTFCSIVLNCKTACGDCADEAERLADCFVNDSTGCDPNCSGGEGGDAQPSAAPSASLFPSEEPANETAAPSLSLSPSGEPTN